MRCARRSSGATPALQMTPWVRSSPISASVSPSRSFSTSSVCWPSRGPRCSIRPGVFDSLGMTLGTMTVSPSCGSSIETMLRRAWNCRSPKISAMLFNGAAGAPTALQRASISSRASEPHQSRTISFTSVRLAMRDFCSP